ncbi:MAG TPA: exo-beta-N-acetylmuramidase NamZ domain-containing protein [Bryobacteraceae bacterium]|nr:exo-beta-N-acetylmuramidase NamZ domain-containing protein [Bryobacteraceae bacterium]
MRAVVLLALAGAVACAQQQYPKTDAQMVDRIVDEAVQTNVIPGAVLVIGHDGQVIYQKAYGFRAVVPQREVMTADTIFDAASLTKVVATTPSIMKLFEEGKLRLDDPVTKYLPEFQGGKSDITVRLLMTHFSGLPPDVDLVPRWSGYETGIQKALTAKPVAPPGAKFIYSDINFELLGEIVRRLSGMTLAQFAQQEIFSPLGMKETEFLPGADLKPRIAPTEIDPDTGLPFRGVVHDPTARYMGGIAGHAGVFTTADDLSKYAEMLLGMGERNGVRVFSPMTVKKFTAPGSPADQPILRGLGWDIDSPFSSNRGELYPIGSYGHTGFTGTSMWMDPTTDSFVILLTNAVHPHRGHSLSSLRSRLATAVAGSFGVAVNQQVALTGYNETITGAGVHRVVNRNAQTLTGLDVLEQEGFSGLRGKRVGLITNHTGLDREGRRDVDVMKAAGVNVTTLFSPEHGISGTADETVGDSRDAKTGLPIVSLYRPERRRLTAAQLEKLDAVVYDIQDIGARTYTYSCTMLYALEEAAKAKKPFFLLDRPNPITGVHVEGPVMESNNESFVGCYTVPLRHGMTFGELATMANAEQHWGADLQVIRMKNWERGDWFDSTGVTWINPSPNMRSLDAALLYPGLVMLESNTNLSLGRGTDSPFEQIGADWIQGQALAEYLNSQFIPGVRVYATRFTPTASHFEGKTIEGVRFVITDRETFDSTRLGVEVAAGLEKLYPGKLDFSKDLKLMGRSELVQEFKGGREASFIEGKLQKQAKEFVSRRQPYLLY